MRINSDLRRRVPHLPGCPGQLEGSAQGHVRRLSSSRAICRIAPNWNQRSASSLTALVPVHRGVRILSPKPAVGQVQGEAHVVCVGHDGGPARARGRGRRLMGEPFQEAQQPRPGAGVREPALVLARALDSLLQQHQHGPARATMSVSLGSPSRATGFPGTGEPSGTTSSASSLSMASSGTSSRAERRRWDSVCNTLSHRATCGTHVPCTRADVSTKHDVQHRCGPCHQRQDRRQRQAWPCHPHQLAGKDQRNVRNMTICPSHASESATRISRRRYTSGASPITTPAT